MNPVKLIKHHLDQPNMDDNEPFLSKQYQKVLSYFIIFKFLLV